MAFHVMNGGSSPLKSTEILVRSSVVLIIEKISGCECPQTLWVIRYSLQHGLISRCHKSGADKINGEQSRLLHLFRGRT